MMNTHSAPGGVSLRKTILSVALPVIALLAPDCAPDLSVSGGAGDDFPNSKTAVGQLIANNLLIVGEWTDLSAVPDSVDPAIFAGDTLLRSMTTDTAASLGKEAAGAQAIDSVIWDYTDTLLGSARYIHIAVDWLTAKADTVTVRYDDLARDQIVGNETIVHVRGNSTNRISGATTTYDVRDADSNGYLDTAYIMHMTNEIVRTRCNAAFGNWGNQTGIFDGTHIRISRLQLFYLVGADTATFFQLYDRDGDGHIYLPGEANRILFEQKFIDAFAVLPRKPVSGTVSLEGALATGSMSRFAVDRLDANYVYRDGTRDRISITGAQRDSLLSGRDSITVTFMRSSPDRLLYDSLAVRFVLVPISATTGYGLARISMIAAINGTDVKELRWSFIPDAPMLPGQVLKFTPGNFEATIVYSSRSQGTLQGRLSNGIFLLRYTAEDGSVRDVSYSQDGQVLE